MAYNPFLYQPTYPAIPQFQPQQNSITWVQGIEGAKAYPVGAGNSVLLMDSDQQYMYIKSADNTGMPTLKIYAYSEVNETKPPESLKADYVTRAEFEEALAKIKPKKRKVIEVEDDE